MHLLSVLVHFSVDGAVLAFFSILAYYFYRGLRVYHPITTHRTCLFVSLSFSPALVYILSYTYFLLLDCRGDFITI